ncbi:MAG: hypothetical protein U0667_02795 [Chloroflexota bacterium]
MDTQHDITAGGEPRHRLRILQVIEDAERATRMCTCGEIMVVDGTDDAVWLECPTFREPTQGRFRWLRAGVREVLHDRHVIVAPDSRAA